MEPTGQGRRLSDLARLFLKLGTTAFGGPAAHIAMMEREVVRHRQWLAHEEFLDLLGAANFIPGPNSTEMAIHIGYRRAGWPELTRSRKLLHSAGGLAGHPDRLDLREIQ